MKFEVEVEAKFRMVLTHTWTISVEAESEGEARTKAQEQLAALQPGDPVFDGEDDELDDRVHTSASDHEILSRNILGLVEPD